MTLVEGLAFIATSIALLWAGLRVYAILNRRRSRKTPYSFEEGTSGNGESAPRRSWRTKDGDLFTTFDGVTTLYDNFENACQKFSQLPCLGQREVLEVFKEQVSFKGKMREISKPKLSPFKWKTYSEFHAEVSEYASGLRRLDLNPGDRFGLYEETCYHWTLCEHACFRQDLTIVTVYANLGEEALVHAINQCELACIQTNERNVSQLMKYIDQLDTLKTIIYSGKLAQEVEEAAKNHGIQLYTCEEVAQIGKQHPSAASPPEPESLAVIMYTSGSTGLPKGVMITHANLVGCLSGVIPLVDIGPEDAYLNYLPLAHVLALAVENAAIGKGARIGYGTSRTLSSTTVKDCQGDIPELRPTVFAGVPVIFDRIKGAVETKMSQGNKVVAKLWQIAYKAKKAAMQRGEPSPLWDFLVFRKAQAQLGGRLRFLVSGGAPLSGEAQDWLRIVFGCPVSQGYGLTETCGAGTFQELDDFDVGVAGAPIPSVEIKLVDVPDMNYLSSNNQGEVWIRGASISKGYYKNPEKTAEEYHEGGWFSTGDIGEFTSRGTLRIIDRKKNLIKPPHGEYIAIERLESEYKQDQFVSNIMVYVDSGHNDCLAFICPDSKVLEHWAAENNISGDIAHLCDNERVKKAVLESLLETANRRNLRRMEQIKKIHLEPPAEGELEGWTPDNGFLTAAMKLARPTLVKHYAPLIEKMYS